MQIIFTIPTKYIERIKNAFEVETEAEFKEKIKDIVKDTIRLYEEEKAVQKAREDIVIEDDLIS